MTERKGNEERLSFSASINPPNSLDKTVPGGFWRRGSVARTERVLGKYQASWFRTDRNHLPLVVEAVRADLPETIGRRVFNGLAPTLFEQATAETVGSCCSRAGIRLGVGRPRVLFEEQGFLLLEEWGRKEGFLQPPGQKMAAYREWPYDVFLPVWLNFDRVPPTCPGWPRETEELGYSATFTDPRLIAGGYFRAAIMYQLLGDHFVQNPYPGVEIERARKKANDRMTAFIAWQAVGSGDFQLGEAGRTDSWDWRINQDLLVVEAAQAVRYWIRRDADSSGLNGTGREWGKEQVGKRLPGYLDRLERVVGALDLVTRGRIEKEVGEALGVRI